MIGEFLVEGLGWVEGGGLHTGGCQRVPHGVASVGKEQWSNQRIQKRFVVIPLIYAALPDRLPCMDRGYVCGRGRRKLRGQLTDQTIVDDAPEEGMALGKLLEEAPAKGIHEEQDHGLVVGIQIITGAKGHAR